MRYPALVRKQRAGRFRPNSPGRILWQNVRSAMEQGRSNAYSAMALDAMEATPIESVRIAMGEERNDAGSVMALGHRVEPTAQLRGGCTPNRHGKLVNPAPAATAITRDCRVSLTCGCARLARNRRLRLMVSHWLEIQRAKGLGGSGALSLRQFSIRYALPKDGISKLARRNCNLPEDGTTTRA